MQNSAVSTRKHIFHSIFASTAVFFSVLLYLHRSCHAYLENRPLLAVVTREKCGFVSSKPHFSGFMSSGIRVFHWIIITLFVSGPQQNENVWLQEFGALTLTTTFPYKTRRSVLIYGKVSNQESSPICLYSNRVQIFVSLNLVQE